MQPNAPEDLVRQCQQSLPRDTRAFEQLVALYKERVFATAYRLMGNQQDADDMAQEAFLKIYHHIKDLAEPATVTAWIYRITTHTCLDALTTRQRRPRTASLHPEVDEDREGSFVDTQRPTPEEEALHRELRRCVEETLAALGPLERTAIVLRDVEDRPYQEIADTLALGLSAVKMRIHRARAAFGQLFPARCPELWQRGAAVLAPQGPPTSPRGSVP